MSNQPVFLRETAERDPLASLAALKQPPPEPVAQQQSGLTLLTRVQAGKMDELRALLDQIRDNMSRAAPKPGTVQIRFGDLTTTHFCRFVLIPADATHDCPASLAFESNYDGDLGAHLEELIAAGKDALVALYQRCEGWPPGAPGTEAIRAYLEKQSIENAAFYIGHRGLSQRWIQNDIQVQAAIEEYLQAAQKKPGWPPSPDELRAGLQQHFAGKPQLSTASFDRDLPSWVGLLPWIVPAALLVPVLVGLLPFLLYKEMTDEPDPLERYFPITNLASMEDRTIQNQLTHLVPIKPGWLRLLALKGVLFTINKLAYHIYNKGDLGGIPSIHFARWAIIDEGKRLLFFSNYDGSWENYLGDFIDKANTGLTGIWSNTLGFPPARFLIWEGATHEERFKQWTRAHQVPTQVWYQAYPHTTVNNVLQNAEIRQQAGGSLSGEALTAWLEKL